MLIVAWLLLLGLLYIFFNALMSHQFNPNQKVQTLVTQDGAKKVVLKPNRQHQYVVNGFIHKQPVIFLIDTGASNVSVPANVAKKLHLIKGLAFQAQTANGVVNIYQTRIASLKIGNITLKNIRANINPHMKGNYVLLGMSALRQLELQQKDGTLTLLQVAQ